MIGHTTKAALLRQRGFFIAVFMAGSLFAQAVQAQSAINTVTVTLPGGITDPQPGNNTSVDDDPIGLPTISIEKAAPTLTIDADSNGFISEGDTLTYVVTVTNIGTIDLTNVVVNDPMITPSEEVCATVAPGETCVLTGTHVVTAEEAAAGEIVNTATADSDQTLPVSDTVTAVVTGSFELRVIKTASPRDVKIGDIVRYTLSIQNVGLLDVVDATIIDTPPPGFSYVDGTLTVDDADDAGRLVDTYPMRVDQVDIPVGQRASVVYLLRVGAAVRPGLHVNSVFVQDAGNTISNVATAEVQLVSDPLLDESLIMGTVFDDRNADGWQDKGEHGIPGVRIASVEGLLIETDQFGRYHLVGIEGGPWERGRNFILKVDPVTLPAGSEFTTDNPLLRRVTPGLPVRFDFGVKLPPGEIQLSSDAIEMTLGEVMFDAESAVLRAEYLPVIDKIAAQVREHQRGEVVLSANGETPTIAYDRAKAVQTALAARISPEAMAGLTISLRTDLNDPNSRVLALGEAPVVGTFLFDTDQATIKPEFVAIVTSVAADIEKIGGGVVGVIGHADRRGSDAYNAALGLRRAKAVYEAIAAKLTPDVRSKLRVDISADPTAPVDGGKGTGQ